MSNGQLRSLSTLVQSATTGGYTLPGDVTDTYRVWQRLQQTELPQPREFDADEVADRIVQSVTDGEPLDPIALCRGFLKAEEDRRLHDQAGAVLRSAILKAASTATSTAADAADRIITEHLRPAYTELLDKAREVAAILRPYHDSTFQLDLQGIVAASSTKVRGAYLDLPALVERHRVIRQARDQANTVGTRQPQHDTLAMFSNFRTPLAFHPNWRHPAPVPRVPSPQGPTEYLLWLASEQSAVGQPWLPTVAEQDAAWWDQFGDNVKQQQVGLALGGSRGLPMSAA